MKKVVLGIVVLIIAATGGFIWWDRSRTKEPETSRPASQTETTEESDPDSDTEEAEPAAEINTIAIEEFAFGPAELTVPVGTTVTWTNKDSVAHTVTPDEDGAFTGSELLSEGETFSVTFDSPGEFAYHCQPHPQMTGKIIVTE